MREPDSRQAAMFGFGGRPGTTTLIEEDVAELDDLVLIARARDSDEAAIAELYSRHHQAALRVARRMTDPVTAEDVVGDAFMKVMLALRAGGGPTQAFRPYLLTAVRNAYYNYVRGDSRYVWVDDHEDARANSNERDFDDLHQESALLASAFSSLPERWQAVLWHTTVEGDDHKNVGKLLGITPTAVRALSYRARDGLRSAYLAAHLAEPIEEECREIRDLLISYTRRRLRGGQCRQVDDHTDLCARCSGALVELTALNSNLGALLAPALLGTLGIGYAAKGTASTGAIGWLSGRRGARSAVGGGIAAALALVVAGGAFALTSGDAPGETTVADGQPPASTSERARERPFDPVADAPDKPPTTGASISSPSSRPRVDGEVPAPAPSLSTPETATKGASPSPKPGPTAVPTPTLSPPPPPTPTPGPIPAPAPSDPPPSNPPPSVRTQEDLSLTGGSTTAYPAHYHLAMSVTAAADQTELVVQGAGILSVIPHQDLGFPGTTCTLVGDVATCQLPTGTGLFAIDIVTVGPLSVTVQIAGPENDDPDASNNTLTFTS